MLSVRVLRLPSDRRPAAVGRSRSVVTPALLSRPVSRPIVRVPSRSEARIVQASLHSARTRTPRAFRVVRRTSPAASSATGAVRSAGGVAHEFEVRDAVAALSGKHREVIELTFDEDLDDAQIAERIGVPVGTVRSRTYYALRALRLALEERGLVA
jgi:DNA-directed RNA polymerase specialized sigma24 family protein